MLDFLKSYGELIASGILFIMAVITLIVKRRPKTVDDFVQCLSMTIEKLPELITYFEKPGSGASKKESVIYCALEYFKTLLGRSLTVNEENTVRKSVSDHIEAILSTPQKKEEK